MTKFNEWMEELFEQIEILFIGFLGALSIVIILYFLINPLWGDQFQTLKNDISLIFDLIYKLSPFV